VPPRSVLAAGIPCRQLHSICAASVGPGGRHSLPPAHLICAASVGPGTIETHTIALAKDAQGAGNMSNAASRCKPYLPFERLSKFSGFFTVATSPQCRDIVGLILPEPRDDLPTGSAPTCRPLAHLLTSPLKLDWPKVLLHFSYTHAEKLTFWRQAPRSLQ
jgi:hypothetical protein